jgi:hypothetical protein
VASGALSTSIPSNASNAAHSLAWSTTAPTPVLGLVM